MWITTLLSIVEVAIDWFEHVSGIDWSQIMENNVRLRENWSASEREKMQIEREIRYGKWIGAEKTWMYKESKEELKSERLLPEEIEIV